MLVEDRMMHNLAAREDRRAAAFRGDRGDQDTANKETVVGSKGALIVSKGAVIVCKGLFVVCDR